MTAMSAIYHRPGSANLWVRYHHRGKQYRESCGSPDPAVARALLKRRLAELGADTLGLRPFVPPAADKITVAELLDDLAADFRLRNIKSLKTSLCTLGKAKCEFGRYRAVEITAQLVDNWYSKQLAKGPLRAGPQAKAVADAATRPATLNRVVSMLSQALSLAHRSGQIAQRPRLRLLSERGNARQGFLGKADLEILITTLPDYLQDMTRFAALTGWRLGAIRSLTWEDVDLVERTIRLRPEFDKAGVGQMLPLEGQLFEIIGRQKQNQVRTDSFRNYVFSAKEGKPIGDFRRAWSTALAKAGLAAGIHFHDLRRTAARNMRLAGVPETVAMRITGHVTNSMYRRYSIVDLTDLVDAQQKLQTFLNGQSAERKVVPLRQGR